MKTSHGPRHASAWIATVATTLASLGIASGACGSRTGFTSLADFNGEGADDASPLRDGAAIDRDARIDGDARDPDALARPDSQNGKICPAYVLSLRSVFSVFYPDTGQFLDGSLAKCSADPSARPHTMTVDPKGQAYILFEDALLYHFDPITKVCEKTSFKPHIHGLASVFGMAFRESSQGLQFFARGKGDLFQLDPASFAFISQLTVTDDALSLGDLQTTHDGRLFAFDKVRIDEIDATSGSAKTLGTLPDLGQGPWTFLAWNGDYMLFDADALSDGPTTVRRYRPADGTIVEVTTHYDAIVGAGVPPCPD